MWARLEALRRDQRGFTLIELTIAMVIVFGGVFAMIATIDTTRALTNVAERKEATAHIAEREMERLLALDYEALAHPTAPLHAVDEHDPRFWVTDGASPTYRWNQRSNAPTPHTGPLIVDAAGTVGGAPTTWNDGRLSGTIHRFVTWVDDAECGSSPLTLCPGTEDYKRVTVVVTVNGGQRRTPTIISSIAQDPAEGPAGAVIDGVQNPLSSPDTKCLNDAGQLVQCAASLGSSNALTWFLHDTPASAGVRQEILGSHEVHPTVAPTGLCVELIITVGCPQPDLLSEQPPPLPDVLPTLFNYATDLVGTITGGRILKRDTTCAGDPSTTDNGKVQFWASAPLAAATKLTGDGSLSLYTETLDDSTGSRKLCVAVYDTPQSLLNLIAFPPTRIGSASYVDATWPTDPELVAFAFDVSGSDYTVPAGHRIGIRVWAASDSGGDIAAIYDHPSYPASVQLTLKP